MKDHSSIHLTFKFHLRDGNVEDVVPNLPKPPVDTWKKGDRAAEDGLAYKTIIHGCRFLDEKILQPFLTEIQELITNNSEVFPEETTTELAIEIYTQDSGTVKIEWESIVLLEAFGAKVTIDVCAV